MSRSDKMDKPKFIVYNRILNRMLLLLSRVIKSLRFKIYTTGLADKFRYIAL